MEILISGASTGIGRSAAVHMARKGHSVWAGVRSQKSFDEVRKLNVQGLKPVFLDVTDEKSITACVSEIKKSAGIIHGLVNNAGIVVGGPVEAVTLDEWRQQFEVNVFGQIRVIQLTLPLLRESKGRIVNISSIAGKISQPFMSPYCASKFALEAVSDSLRREVRAHGVQVSLVEPGPIDTPIWQKSIKTGEERKSKYSDEVTAAYGRLIDRFTERVRQAERNSSPVSVVVKAIEHALTARQPRIRYPVGRGIKLATVINRALPDSLMDMVIR